MVVLFIIGMITVMVMPTFRKTSAIEPKEFVAKLNVIMQAAWQQALSSGHTQKVLFDFAAKKISLFEVTHLGVDEDHDKETPVTGSVLDTQATIPDTYKIDNFYIKKKDIMSLPDQTKAWFYLAPSGLAQAIVINITAHEQETKQSNERFGLVLNPFSAQFEYYDTPQRP